MGEMFVSDAPAIEACGLTKRFGRQTAVVDLDLRVEPGAIYGFLGANGAGKSTTIRMILGLLRPTLCPAPGLEAPGQHQGGKEPPAMRHRDGRDPAGGGQPVEHH